jgi:predicted nucleic acid-binding protein
LLRRKKNIADKAIEETITLLENILDIVIPDEITLLRANLLQRNNYLDPFDAIIMAISVSMQPSVFLSRDNSLLMIASTLVPAITPDDYIFHLSEK